MTEYLTSAAHPAALSRGSTVGHPGAAVDAEVFEEFVANIVGDDRDARSQLIDTYLGDAAPRMRDISAGFRSGNTAAVGKAAHGLRSGSALFGALPLAEMLLHLETMARAGAGDLRSVVEEVQAEFDDVVATLEFLRQGEPTLTG